MFHLAVACPHCGARNDGAKSEDAAATPAQRKPELKLSADEARALLAVSSRLHPSKTGLSYVAAGLVWPRKGTAEWVLSVVAAPLTLVTAAVLGYLLLFERSAAERSEPWEESLRGAWLLAVPAAAAAVAATVYEHGGPEWPLPVLGISLGAWIVRQLLRAFRPRDPLS